MIIPITIIRLHSGERAQVFHRVGHEILDQASCAILSQYSKPTEILLIY